MLQREAEARLRKADGCAHVASANVLAQSPLKRNHLVAITREIIDHDLSKPKCCPFPVSPLRTYAYSLSLKTSHSFVTPADFDIRSLPLFGTPSLVPATPHNRSNPPLTHSTTSP